MVQDPQSTAVNILRALRERNPEVTAAVVTTADGFPVHMDAEAGTDSDMLAATAADLAARATRMSADLGHGSTLQMMVHSENGYAIAARINDELCLALVAKADASLGLLLMGVRKAATELADAL